MIVFANRVDVPVIAQIAVAHAQFETIHPFLDGNGRVGRALIQAMLRGGQLTRSVAVPVSAGLLHDTAEYCDALGEYRSGNVEPIVRSIAEASFGAVANGCTLDAQIAIDRLVDAGILAQTTDGRRNRIWQAEDVVQMLDEFAARAKRRRH